MSAVRVWHAEALAIRNVEVLQAVFIALQGDACNWIRGWDAHYGAVNDISAQRVGCTAHEQQPQRQGHISRKGGWRSCDQK